MFVFVFTGKHIHCVVAHACKREREIYMANSNGVVFNKWLAGGFAMCERCRRLVWFGVKCVSNNVYQMSNRRLTGKGELSECNANSTTTYADKIKL